MFCVAGIDGELDLVLSSFMLMSVYVLDCCKSERWEIEIYC